MEEHATVTKKERLFVFELREDSLYTSGTSHGIFTTLDIAREEAFIYMREHAKKLEWKEKPHNKNGWTNKAGAELYIERQVVHDRPHQWVKKDKFTSVCIICEEADL